MSRLELREVSVSYGTTRVIERLSLAVQVGEIFTLLGPSGSGKSTLLLAIAGLLSPSHGDVFIDGKRVTTLPPNIRGVGMVFQSYSLFPHKTVFSNVAYALEVRKMARSEVAARVSEMLKLVQLFGLEHRYPNQLSGGQQQRVALARALAFHPQLLLLDEPLGALDKQLREEMEFEIRRIHRASGATALYVTHNQEEAMSLSDRIGIIRNGCIEQTGSPKEIYDNPCNEFVASFVGTASFLRATIMQSYPGSCSLRIFGTVLRDVPLPSWSVAPNMNVTLMVRPEQCTITRNMVLADSVLPASVEDLTYRGDAMLVRCRLQNGTLISVRHGVGSDEIPIQGQSVGIVINGKQSRLFRSSLQQHAIEEETCGAR